MVIYVFIVWIHFGGIKTPEIHNFFKYQNTYIYMYMLYI